MNDHRPVPGNGAALLAEELRMPDFLDVGFTYRALQDEIDAAMRRVMRSGSYVLGSEVAAFETEFAVYCGAAHCVGVGNGYDALCLALRAVGVKAGDEVVVSGHTFIATWLAIMQAGAIPVPVDARPDTMLIDVDLLMRRVGPKTRAVVIVPLYGLPVDLGWAREELARRGIPVIEDAAQAHGATVNGLRVGTLGDIAAFSFYPGKNLGAFGDGGAVVTDRADWAASIRRWANYGSSVKYHHVEIGLNSRLDELQAAVLRAKLGSLDAWTEHRRAIAAHYIAALADIAGLELPAQPRGTAPAWHLFVVRHPERDALRKALAQRGVETLMHYPIPPHRSEALRDLVPGVSLPVAERIAETCISLPIGPHMTLGQAARVSEAFRDAVRALAPRSKAVSSC